MTYVLPKQVHRGHACFLKKLKEIRGKENKKKSRIKEKVKKNKK